jgi:hypothetical protein
MVYLLSFLAAALFPLALAGYGGHLATIALPDTRLRRKAFVIVWGLAIVGTIVSAVFQIALYRSDQKRDGAEVEFRADVRRKLDAIISEPDSSKKKDDAGDLKAQIDKTPRAHVHITKFDWKLPADESGRAEVKVIFENNGHAPIKQLISAGHAGYYLLVDGDRAQQQTFEEQMIAAAPNVTTKQMEDSDNEIPVGADRSLTVESSPWTQNAIDLFSSGRALVYAAGVLTYSDAHSTRKTKYCGYVGRDGNMKFCGKGNEEP